jgi:hypothetical protein
VDKLTIHFGSGATAVATVDPEEDFELEAQRIKPLRTKFEREGRNVPFALQGDPADVEAYIESCVTNPREPHWVWIGDVFVFTQTVSGVEQGDTKAA